METRMNLILDRRNTINAIIKGWKDESRREDIEMLWRIAVKLNSIQNSRRHGGGSKWVDVWLREAMNER